MDAFVLHHQKNVIGVLSGFDRLLFRGTLRSISYGDGLDGFLGAVGVRYKDWTAFAQGLSERLKAHAQELARKARRPYLYLSSSGDSKEQRAMGIAKRDGIEEGLVCVLSCVEPCRSFGIARDGMSSWRFISQERKCLHLYFYYMDREFGLMHVRLATWLPFGIQVCLNGREYLARRMNQAGIGYEQRDNCFTRIDDLKKAQRLMQELENRKWPRTLNALARRVNPLLATGQKLESQSYYWSLRESEYATDVMFKDAAALQGIYPALVEHAMRRLSCRDVLRFLGRRTNRRYNGDAGSSLLKRTEGVRVKHWAEENSIKMYDKQGSVLRIETTINNVRRFKTRRMTVRNGVRAMHWIPMRHGVADLPRRVEISRLANGRYLEALAVVGVPEPARQLLDAVSQRVVKNDRPYRPLRPVTEQEAAMFEAALDGQFLLRGFGNRELRQRLGEARPRDPREARRQSARMTRLLRLLRAHALIRKVSGTRFYRVTDKGHHIMTAALRLRNADVSKLAA